MLLNIISSEQQYFISNMGEGAAHNRVCEAILNAVERALDADREFRVMVVIPDALEDMLVLHPISYFTRRTLLQDSPVGLTAHLQRKCLRTRIQRLLQKDGPAWNLIPMLSCRFVRWHKCSSLRSGSGARNQCLFTASGAS